jgi:AmiR/NasT family two-component response regulator
VTRLEPEDATQAQVRDAATERRLRVLLADERRDALEGLARLLRELGHEVLPAAINLSEVAARIEDHRPDVALVRLHEDYEHALRLIAQIVAEADVPVLALLDAEDPDFVAAAAREGIYAVAQPVTAASVQGAIEVAMRRHAEVQQLGEQVGQLETALQRRAAIERAKGILMERHGIGDDEAFERLRAHARSTNRKVVDVARAVSEGHALLPRSPDRE